jgi:hypothetical protein
VLSWAESELDQFINDMGYRPVKGGAYNKSLVVQEIIDEMFEVVDIGTELLCNTDKVYTLLRKQT